MKNKLSKTEQPCTIHSVTQRFLEKSKALENVMYKVAILQIIALCISCGIGMILTTKEIYWQQIFIIPLHVIFVFIIIKLNKKWCEKVEAM